MESVKQMILEDAVAKYSESEDDFIVEDFQSDEWRLAKIDQDIRRGSHELFFEDEIVIARKSDVPSGNPQIFVYSMRTKVETKLHVTDPVEFLED